MLVRSSTKKDSLAMLMRTAIGRPGKQADL
jgi:hypothetical protein